MKKVICGLALIALSGVVLAEQEVGKVLVTKNDVSAVRGNAQAQLKRKSSILKNDLIKTGNKARAQFKFNDGTIFTLGENAAFKVNQYQYENGQEPKAEFELLKGVFRSVTGKITQVTNPSFKINTPMGSIGIRGTDFWGGYLDEDKIDVIFLSGEHSIVVSNEYGEVEITEHGTGVTIEQGKAPSSPVKWSTEKLSRAVETITID